MYNTSTIESIRISVIIPVKNRAGLVGQTLDSILNQTLKPFEIILVDDDSTDELADTLLPYGDSIICIKNKGKGPGAARNTGFERATGEFIKFFDSDDLMTSTSLYEQAKVLIQTNKNFVTSPYIYAEYINGTWKSPENIILNYRSFPQTHSLQYWMIWGLFIPIPSMLFRKGFLDQIGPWPTNIVTSEDWIHLWNITKFEPFPAHTNACAFIYRLHTYQSTGANMDNLERDKEKFCILEQTYKGSMQSSAFTWFDRLIFKTKFYQMASVTKDELFKNKLLEAAGMGQWMVWNYFRLKMKIGRNKTESNWQPMHGISKDEKVLSSFLKDIV